MRLLLILPRDHIYRYRGLTSRIAAAWAPLTLTTLAALVPEECRATIDIVDEGLQRPDYERRPAYDVVGITCVAASAGRAYDLAAYWRGRGAFVVLGGAHPTLVPEEASRHADAVVVGLAEETWPELLRDLLRGSPRQIYHATYDGPLSSPIARRDLGRATGLLGMPSIVANRTCDHACRFCSLHRMYGRGRVVRPVGEVIDEIRHLKTRRLTLLDSSPLSDADYARELFRALVPLRVRWMGAATADVADRPDLLDLMVASGCEGLLIGLESPSQASQDENHKAFNHVQAYPRVLRTLHERRILVLGCFVLGFDGDTRDGLETIVDWSDDLGVDLPRFAVLTPFPGTLLHDDMDRTGRLLTRDWSYYDAHHVVFRPARMSPSELQAVFHRTVRRAYTARRIARRAASAPRYKALVAAANWALRSAVVSFLDEEARSGAVLPCETVASPAVET